MASSKNTLAFRLLSIALSGAPTLLGCGDGSDAGSTPEIQGGAGTGGAGTGGAGTGGAGVGGAGMGGAGLGGAGMGGAGSGGAGAGGAAVGGAGAGGAGAGGADQGGADQGGAGGVDQGGQAGSPGKSCEPIEDMVCYETEGQAGSGGAGGDSGGGAGGVGGAGGAPLVCAPEPGALCAPSFCASQDFTDRMGLPCTLAPGGCCYGPSTPGGPAHMSEPVSSPLPSGGTRCCYTRTYHGAPAAVGRPLLVVGHPVTASLRAGAWG